jgi:hypothetical protein
MFVTKVLLLELEHKDIKEVIARGPKQQKDLRLWILILNNYNELLLVACC